MSQFSENTESIVVDGDVATVLRVLRNHTVLTESKLYDLVNQHLADISENSFYQILSHIKNDNFILNHENSLKLTESGEEWLDKVGSESTVEEEDTENSDPKVPYDVAKLKMESRHLSIFQALRKIDKKEIHMNPEFQRAFVWDVVKQSRLIESILIRIPLPAFYLDATNQTKWTVVDGLQRLTTIHRYCVVEGFRLTGLQFLNELNDKLFSELPAHYKVLIEDDTQLLFYNLMPGTPIEAKYTIFSRVNTGGMQLTAQEIRHALNQGKITDLLGRVSKSNAFRTATEGVVESLRMSDRELILRAMAFMHLGVDVYKEFGELDAFLLHAMSELNKLSDNDLKILEAEFLTSLVKVKSIFGRYAFRKFYESGGRRSPLNKALFETWVVSVRSYDDEKLKRHRGIIMEDFIKLLNNFNSKFLRSISASTGSFSAVSTRFSEIKSLLESAIP